MQTILSGCGENVEPPVIQIVISTLLSEFGTLVFRYVSFVEGGVADKLASYRGTGSKFL